jgi:hypothetical protein
MINLIYISKKKAKIDKLVNIILNQKKKGLIPLFFFTEILPRLDFFEREDIYVHLLFKCIKNEFFIIMYPEKCALLNLSRVLVNNYFLNLSVYIVYDYEASKQFLSPQINLFIILNTCFFKRISKLQFNTLFAKCAFGQ